MPKFRSKPREITAVQFSLHKLDHIPAKVYMTMTGEWVVYNQLHLSEIKLKPGDYIRIDDPNDNYPIDEETFLKTYEPIGETTDAKETNRP